MNLYTRIHPWGTAAGSATEYAEADRIAKADIDYEAAWELYYFLADRRRKEGLTALMLRDVIDVALHLEGTE